MKTLMNTLKKKEVGRIYKEAFPKLSEEQKAATEDTAQRVYGTVTTNIVAPCKTYVRRWARGRPKHWTKELEGMFTQRRKVFREICRSSDMETLREHNHLNIKLKKAIRK